MTMPNNNIRSIREEKNLTLKQLAKKTKPRISFGYIGNLETGKKTNPTLDVMVNISKALEKPVIDVFPDMK